MVENRLKYIHFPVINANWTHPAATSQETAKHWKVWEAAAGRVNIVTEVNDWLPTFCSIQAGHIWGILLAHWSGTWLCVWLRALPPPLCFLLFGESITLWFPPSLICLEKLQKEVPRGILIRCQNHKLPTMRRTSASTPSYFQISDLLTLSLRMSPVTLCRNYILAGILYHILSSTSQNSWPWVMGGM